MTQKRFGYLPCDVVVDGVKESKCDEGSIRTQDLDGDGLILFILWIDREMHFNCSNFKRWKSNQTARAK